MVSFNRIGFSRVPGGDSPKVPQSSRPESLGFPRNTPSPVKHPPLKNPTIFGLNNWLRDVFLRFLFAADSLGIKLTAKQPENHLDSKGRTSSKLACLGFIFMWPGGS